MSKATEHTTKIEDTEHEIHQLENRRKLLQNKRTAEERKARTRRLIQRGAILEHVFPSLASLEHEEVLTLLSALSSLPEARALLEKAAETEGAT